MSLVLLAGGKSSRLNAEKEKALLKLVGSETIIESIINCLKDIFDEIIIVTNNIDDYKFLGFKVVPDIVKGKGPLGGIYTGLKSSNEERNFVLGCDMPFVNAGLIKYMLKFKDPDIVIPRFNGYIEPLHAVYSKNILPTVETQLEKEELKISETIKKIKKIKYIKKEEIEKFDKSKLCFFNINNEKDLEEARRIINEKRA